ncbi:hypothetical protein O3U67_12525 [Brevundimonas diminuta]|uniref:hypothetical protein n=1 Tax=Brevundimonas diminuta TaxID=293 RepID=UPI0022AF2E20|nr:hypothetical protein [Brevundimonas diminuta]MCZ4108911.1 hypothetical protein [Brevundimonas diminuta]
MFRLRVILAGPLMLSACSTDALEPGRTADTLAADTQCRTTRQPDGGLSVNCILWERITTTTTTTTTLPNGETVTTVQRTQTRDDL